MYIHTHIHTYTYISFVHIHTYHLSRDNSYVQTISISISILNIICLMIFHYDSMCTYIHTIVHIIMCISMYYNAGASHSNWSSILEHIFNKQLWKLLCNATCGYPYIFQYWRYHIDSSINLNL